MDAYQPFRVKFLVIELMFKSNKQLERFFAKIRCIDNHWIWQGSLTWNLRPQTKINGITARCYRITYEIWKGEIPSNLEIDHLCDYPTCCNPDHLEAVTRAENEHRYSLRRNTKENNRINLLRQNYPIDYNKLSLELLNRV